MKASTAASRSALDAEPDEIPAAGYSRWSPQRLRREGSYWRARILSTAVHIELFDWLGERAKGSRTARRRFGGSQEGWKVFLDALTAMGLLHKRAGQYRNSVFALRHLRSGGAAFFLPEHDAWNAWRALPELLTTGKRPKTSRPFLTDRKRSERLLRSLDRDARKIAPYLIERFSLEGTESLLDVGGGLGSFALAWCRRFTQLRATVIEHPRVAPLARRKIRNAHLEKRMHVLALDIAKDPLPRRFDVVLISNVLHGQGARENRRLLKSAYRSLNRGGRLILRDVLMNREGTDPEWGALFSVSLLLHTPRGRCYALDEVNRWLRQAGFSLTEGPFRSSPLFFDPDSILIARKG